MYKRFVKKWHDSRGMSLVELMVVMAIMSIVIMAVLSLYIPAYQSTIVQTQVSDIQGNLRLAMRVMSRDLLSAGFLVSDNPVIFEASITPTTAENPDPVDFTIRTRIVGSDFARISNAAVDSGKFRLTITDPDMVSNFPDGSWVRLFEPITTDELIKDTGSSADRVYNVSTTGETNTIDISTGNLTLTDIIAETVMVRVPDDSQPALQTIRYQLTNGSLLRTVNTTTQVLARNVDLTDTTPPGGTSFFTYDNTDEGRVIRIDIRLTGITQATGNTASGSAKSRAVQSAVKLRNVY